MLQESAELDAALSGVMQSPVIPKIGLELTGDLSKVSGSYPNAVAFQKVFSILDLQNVWLKIRERLGKPRVGGGNRVGLSSLCDTLLGKPLDKSMQARFCCHCLKEEGFLNSNGYNSTSVYLRLFLC